MPAKGKISLRVYQALLTAYPKEFRDAYGPHMMQVFRDECREAIGRAGVVGLIELWARTLLDLVLTAFAERSNLERPPVETVAIYPSLARLGEAAAVLGGVLSFLVNARKLMPFFFEGRRPLAEAGFGPIVSLLSFLSTFAFTLLFVVALTCLYALLGRRSIL